eukprot:5752549-Prymnesium_polylepis.1
MAGWVRCESRIDSAPCLLAGAGALARWRVRPLRLHRLGRATDGRASRLLALLTSLARCCARMRARTAAGRQRPGSGPAAGRSRAF